MILGKNYGTDEIGIGIGNGKVSKNDALMLIFSEPQTQTHIPKLKSLILKTQRPTTNSNIENVPFLPT